MQIHCIPAFHFCTVMKNARFEVFRSPRDSRYYFRLRSRGNLEIILSSEGYASKQDCLDGIRSVKINSPFDSNYEVRNGSDTYTFNLWAGSWEIIGHSERYTSSAARDNGIEAVKRDAAVAEIVEL